MEIFITKLLMHSAVLIALVMAVVTQRVPGQFAGYASSGQFRTRLTNDVQKYTRQRPGLFPGIQAPRGFGQTSDQRNRPDSANPFLGSTNIRPNNGPNVRYNYARKPIRGNVRQIRAIYQNPIATPIIQNGRPRERANYAGRLVRVTPPPFVVSRYYTAQQLRQPSLASGFQPQRQRVIQPPVITRPRAGQYLAQLFQRPRAVLAPYTGPRYVGQPPRSVASRPLAVITPDSPLYGGFATRGIRNIDENRQNRLGYRGQAPPGYQGPLSPWQPADRRRYSSIGNIVEEDEEDECTRIPGK